MPSTAKPGVLKVGEDLAVTPVELISRDNVAEIIKYTPTTTHVYARPTLIVPPPISRFYFLDLAPGRSFAEYTVSRGIQTFMLSWRNPTREQADWSIVTYAQQMLSAIDDVREVTGSEDVNQVNGQEHERVWCAVSVSIASLGRGFGGAPPARVRATDVP